MAVASWYAPLMLAAGLAAMIHAVLPFAFETTASRTIRQLLDNMTGRFGHHTVPAGT